MRKWFLIFTVVCALVVTVALWACKYERARADEQRNTTKLASPASTAQSQGDKPADQSCDCTPKSPCWYVLLAWPEGMTVWVVILTFAVIGWQADETRKSAEAALKQAKHMETTERAWLLINFVSMKDRELKDGEVVSCYWAIKNVGATPAILLESKARFHAVRLYDEMPEDPVKTLPTIPDYGNPITINERLLAPQDSIEYFTKWERNVDGTFSEFAFPAQANDIWMVVAYGYVKYRDIFGGERESRSCDFICIGKSNNIPMEFRPHPKVPAAYNRCT